MKSRTRRLNRRSRRVGAATDRAFAVYHHLSLSLRIRRQEISKHCHGPCPTPASFAQRLDGASWRPSCPAVVRLHHVDHGSNCFQHGTLPFHHKTSCSTRFRRTLRRGRPRPVEVPSNLVVPAHTHPDLEPRQFYTTEERLRYCAEYLRLSGRSASLHSFLASLCLFLVVWRVGTGWRNHSNHPTVERLGSVDAPVVAILVNMPIVAPVLSLPPLEEERENFSQRSWRVGSIRARPRRS